MTSLNPAALGPLYEAAKSMLPYLESYVMRGTDPKEDTSHYGDARAIVAARAALTLAETPAPVGEVKRFPIQAGDHKSTTPPHPLSIPWSVAEKAYCVYARRYGKGQSLERLAERGGFCGAEMDDMHPAWREETSQIAALSAELAEVRGALAEDYAKAVRDACGACGGTGVGGVTNGPGGEPEPYECEYCGRPMQAILAAARTRGGGQ